MTDCESYTLKAICFFLPHCNPFVSKGFSFSENSFMSLLSIRNTYYMDFRICINIIKHVTFICFVRPKTKFGLK